MMVANGTYAPGTKVEGVMLPPGVYEPVDLWGQFDPPALDLSLMPDNLQAWVQVQAYRMGADPAGLGMAALVACAAAIPDQIKVKVKQHENWTQSARLWAALVGLPSTGKSPIISAAVRPLRKLDDQMFKSWRSEVARWNDTPKDERTSSTPAPQRRLMLQDTTVEAAQGVLEGSPWGVMMLQDELSGFFGAMDKYGGKGGSADRAFWLQSWNGDTYNINRIGRGANQIPNLSISLLGGIQPDPIRKLAADAQDDGLLQRLFPIVLRPKTPGVDEPLQDVDTPYSQLITWLRSQGMSLGLPELVIPFDDGAQAIRQKLERKHFELQSLESVSPKLAAHVGKYDALFPRLCLTYHMIAGGGPVITVDTAYRVSCLLHEFLFRHATVFYSGVLGLSDDHDRLKNIAAYILAHRLDCITNRDVQRGDRAMRKIDNRDIQPLLEQLHTLGWLDDARYTKVGVPPVWIVNPAVHVMFAERGQCEAERRELAKTTIQQALR